MQIVPDMEKVERRKKSDKQKEKFERNGKHTQKHVRAVEALVQRAKKKEGFFRVGKIDLHRPR